MTTEKTLQWQREHPEAMREHKRRYYEKHRDELLRKQHEYYMKRKAQKGTEA